MKTNPSPENQESKIKHRSAKGLRLIVQCVPRLRGGLQCEETPRSLIVSCNTTSLRSLWRQTRERNLANPAHLILRWMLDAAQTPQIPTRHETSAHDILTIAEVANQLGMSVTTARRWIKRHAERLHAWRTGDDNRSGAWRVQRAAFDRARLQLGITA